MSESIIITLRETLEASLVVGIVLAYLSKTMNLKHAKFVWLGVFVGIVVSVILAFVFQVYLGGFEGKAEQIYEGITMLVASCLLTWMILWMINRRKSIKKTLEWKTQMHLQKGYSWGLFWLVFIAVVREGIESVIFLQAAAVNADNSGVLFGAILGVLLAVVLAFAVFKGMMRVPLRPFFTITSLILILFAAGLLAHAVHEFQEAALLPTYVEHLWDMNGFIDENGGAGSLLKGLFGYNGNPSLLEVSFYWLYLVLIAFMWRKIDAKNVL